MLSKNDLRELYDAFGSKQDRAASYEDPALEKLLEHGHFGAARAVFELGPGTGRFAQNLLTNHLSETATYMGIDLSSTMVALTRERLAAFTGRAEVQQSDGSPTFDKPDASVDRFVSSYVLDLLSEADIRAVLNEAHRLLEPGGLLCLAGLSYSSQPLARLKITLWELAYRVNPRWLGGCRPLRMLEFLPRDVWSVEYHTVIVAAATPSEVVVARKVS
ncbi:class I SAM-dependent methyltransferase [soil metagenome]